MYSIYVPIYSLVYLVSVCRLSVLDLVFVALIIEIHGLRLVYTQATL